ncbi:MAG: Ig-like domain-containing protein, partial [Bacteroidota bacterium]
GGGNVSGNTVTYTGINSLEAGKNYYITANFRWVEDIYGNDHPGFSDDEFWTFSTTAAAPTPPGISSLSPTNGETLVSPSTNLTITFNEPVTKGTGNILIKSLSDDVVFEAIDVTSTTLTGSNTLTINPTSDLASSTAYYVEIDAGAINDLEGADFAGVSGNSTWSFTTNNTTPPSIISTTPVDNSVLDLDSWNNTIVLEYSENMVLNTSSTGFFQLMRDLGDEMFSNVKTWDASSADIQINNNIVSLMNSPDLSPTASYAFRIVDPASAPGGTEGIVVGATTGISGPAWNTPLTRLEFTATEFTAPTFSDPSPANEAIVDGEDINSLQFTSTERLYEGSGQIFIRRMTDDAIIQSFDITNASLFNNATRFSSIAFIIFLQEDLLADTELYVEIPQGVLTDLAGNSLIIEKGDWTFTTIEKTAPKLLSFTPVNGSEFIDAASNLTMTFDEDIQKGTSGTLRFFNQDGTFFRSFAATSPEFSVQDNVLTLNPTSNLPQKRSFYINIDAGLVRDLNGNAFEGLSGSDVWTFTTEDNVSPQITSTSPSGVDVSINPTIEIVYNEELQKGSG